MKRLLFGLLALGFTITSWAQNGKSKIESILVYSSSAQISRSAQVTLKKGENELKFTGLSTNIDPNSIRVRTNKNSLVRQIEFVTEYIEEGGNPARVKELADLLESQKIKVKRLDAKMAGIQKELDFLNQNTQLGGSRSATFNLQTFEQTSQFFRTRTESLLNEHEDIKHQKKELAEEINKTLGKIIEARSTATERVGEIHVLVDAEMAGNLKVEFDYLVYQAGWTPKYELRVDEVGKPIELELKADLINATEVDWNSVDLVFSTGDPQRGTTIPALSPWYITQPIVNNPNNQRSQVTKRQVGKTGKFFGTILDATSSEPIPGAVISIFKENGELIQNVLSDFDGYFTVVSNEPVSGIQVVSLGYQKWNVQYPGPGNLNVRLQPETSMLAEVSIVSERPRVERSKTSMISQKEVQHMATSDQVVDGVQVRGEVQINANANRPMRSLAQRFTAKKPYSVKGDGSEISISLLSYSLQAEYQYKGIPKFDPEGFLQAKVVGWDTLGLINGQMNVFVEGGFVGTTTLDVQQPSDTLGLSLGRDPNVVLKRTSIPKKKDKSFFGGKITEVAMYEIDIRNNKGVPISIVVQDQFPLSPSDDIQVEHLETSGGKVDPKTGFITWEITLKPGEQVKKTFGFEVTYPKDKRIYF